MKTHHAKNLAKACLALAAATAFAASFAANAQEEPAAGTAPSGQEHQGCHPHGMRPMGASGAHEGHRPPPPMGASGAMGEHPHHHHHPCGEGQSGAQPE